MNGVVDVVCVVGVVGVVGVVCVVGVVSVVGVDCVVGVTYPVGVVWCCWFVLLAGAVGWCCWLVLVFGAIWLALLVGVVGWWVPPLPGSPSSGPSAVPLMAAAAAVIYNKGSHCWIRLRRRPWVA